MSHSQKKSAIVLVGYIYHNVTSKNIFSENRHGSKRRRPWETCGQDTVDKTKINDHESLFSADTKNESVLKGFIFVCDGTENPSHDVKFPTLSAYFAKGAVFSVVVPLRLTRAVCHAVVTGETVRISLFSLVHFHDCWGEVVFDSCREAKTIEALDFKNHEHVPSNRQFKVIELHSSDYSFNLSETQSFENLVDEFYTERSLYDAPTGKSNCNLVEVKALLDSSEKRKSVKKGPINVTGVVGAISPILVNDAQGEPFALMEIYQFDSVNIDNISEELKNSIPEFIVVVFRGKNALIFHPAIFPGQYITLSEVWRRTWKVTEGFSHFLKSAQLNDKSNKSDFYEKLLLRTPDRVILVEDASSIRLHHIGNFDKISSRANRKIQLTSIRGVVDSVYFHISDFLDEEKADHVLHFVTLKLLDLDDPLYNDNADHIPKFALINFLKFVTPPNIVFGMQPGAIIRAFNIHRISQSSVSKDCSRRDQTNKNCLQFVACLRSSITIECCALESCHIGDAHRVRFLPRASPFFLVPDHRISSICLKPFHSMSPSQYLDQKHFQMTVKSKFPGEFSDAKYLRNLLDHHNHYVSCCVCAKSRLKQKREGNFYKNEKKQRTMRDPYAEFFDHAHSGIARLDDECGSFLRNKFSAFNQDCNSFVAEYPIVVSLADLRNKCVKSFIRKVERFSKCCLKTKRAPMHSSVSSGWTCSYYYNSKRVYTVGKVNLSCTESAFTKSSGFIFDNTCRTPAFILFEKDTLGVVDCTRYSFFGWVQIQCVVVSCICLGRRKKDNIENVENSFNTDREHSSGFNYQTLSDASMSHVFLPLRLANSDSDDILGHVFVFHVEDFVFIASIYCIICPVVLNRHDTQRLLKNNLVRDISHSNPLLSKNGILNRGSICTLSVQNCLEQKLQSRIGRNLVSVIGRLERQRFKFCKIKNIYESEDTPKKCYEGWSITLSHIDHLTQDILSSASVLQTLEVQLLVPLEIVSSSNASTNYFDSAIETIRNAVTRLFYPMSKKKRHSGTSNGSLDNPFFSCHLSMDQLTIGLAWWCASISNRTLPILSGGWESSNNQPMFENAESSSYFSTSIYVEIPLKSCTITKRGYLRFRCHLDEINSISVLELLSMKNSSYSISSQIFEASSQLLLRGSTGKYLPGMINQRLLRMRHTSSVLARDETRCMGKNPLCLLTSLKYNSGVPSATLVRCHWDVCEALRKSHNGYLKPSLLRRICNVKFLGISFCRARAECTQCFEFLTHNKRGDIYLVCPSGCHYFHAAIKWECSIIIDDGTAQAKLYAEREAALLLLGRDLDVDTIEEGAWTNECGVLFQPTLPSSSYLMNCMNNAMTKAKEKCTCYKDIDNHVNHSEKAIVAYNLLPMDAKAEYLLQQYCCQWHQKNFLQKIDLFCRCKPYSKDYISYNQTEIQVVKAIDKVALNFDTAFTTTLPPLSLVLEDACIASDNDHDDNIKGWRLLNSYYHDISKTVPAL